MRTQQDPKLRKALQATLEKRHDELGSRTLGEGLTALAQLSRTNKKSKKQATTRRFIEEFLDHPKSLVRVAAIKALGELGDPQSKGMLESLADDRDDRIGKVAKSALAKLDKERPLVPGEVAELRKIIRELRDDYDSLRDELDQLKLSSDEKARSRESQGNEQDAVAGAVEADETGESVESTSKPDATSEVRDHAELQRKSVADETEVNVASEYAARRTRLDRQGLNVLRFRRYS